ncbi:MAG: P-loop NTPase [SAR324 cluster bacterium]|nr:P-loop NTPase [SAR324 cluster bacterium]
MNPTIIAVASGKGGVGKSLITANLAIALADMGYRTIAVDLDLGGSNLHSYLGLPNHYPGVGDYLLSKTETLESLVVATGIENLGFIPGDARTPCMANISFSEKIRLLLSIKWLKADYILLDLGGGSEFNTLDFFAVARHSLLVTTPEYPAIMNLLTFLRNFLFRAFDRELKKFPAAWEQLHHFRSLPTRAGQLTIPMMIERLGVTDRNAAVAARNLLERYQPRIVYNLCLLPEQLGICHKLNETSRATLAMSLSHFGSLFEDRHAREATYRSVPLLRHYPESTFARRVQKIALDITDKWDDVTAFGADALIEETTLYYQQLKSL